LFVLAAIMFTVAFALPKEETAKGWEPLNRPVEQALLELEPGSSKDQKGGAQAGGEHSAVKGRTGGDEDVPNGGKGQGGSGVGSENLGAEADEKVLDSQNAANEARKERAGGMSSGEPDMKISGGQGTNAQAAGGVEEAAEKTAKGQAGENSGAAGAADEDRGKLDVNRATVEQLKGLKGIGPAKAQAIVDERDKRGFFSSADDLLRVKGIGPKLLAGMKDSIVARP